LHRFFTDFLQILHRFCTDFVDNKHVARCFQPESELPRSSPDSDEQKQKICTNPLNLRHLSVISIKIKSQNSRLNMPQKIDAPPVRYIRFYVEEIWDGGSDYHISELSFWGQ
jgi:hypothetical protein